MPTKKCWFQNIHRNQFYRKATFILLRVFTRLFPNIINNKNAHTFGHHCMLITLKIYNVLNNIHGNRILKKLIFDGVETYLLYRNVKSVNLRYKDKK